MNAKQKSDEAYNRKMYDNLKEFYYDELGLTDFEERIEKRLNGFWGSGIVKRLQEHYSLKGKTILDVGSGWGDISIELAKAGGIVTGVESDLEKVEISQHLNRKDKVEITFRRGYGEHLPFSDKSFDIVVCNAVLEHVRIVPQVISEIVRVTKKGGVIYLACPNYLYPYEPHYKMFFPTWLPKSFGKMFLKLKGKPSEFLDTLNYTTTYGIFSELRKHNVAIRNIGLEKYKSLRGKSKVRQLIKDALIYAGFYPNIELLILKA